jgi:hypothetical protein
MQLRMTMVQPRAEFDLMKKLRWLGISAFKLDQTAQDLYKFLAMLSSSNKVVFLAGTYEKHYEG